MSGYSDEITVPTRKHCLVSLNINGISQVGATGATIVAFSRCPDAVQIFSKMSGYICAPVRSLSTRGRSSYNR
jgi:hypothetical protein